MELLNSAAFEWIILGLNFVFLTLIILENIWCWLFGITASILSVLIFLSPSVALYSEALLYSTYVVLGIYAWITWNKNKQKNGVVPIIKLPLIRHLPYIAIGAFLTYGLGWFFDTYTESKLPWADAFSTSFAFVATYLEAKKILNSWVYWIILNFFSVWLYRTRNLEVMSYMMIGFALFSIVGLAVWMKSYKKQSKPPFNDFDELQVDKL